MRRKALLFAFLFAVASGAQETKTGNDSVLPVPASLPAWSVSTMAFGSPKGATELSTAWELPTPGA